MKLLFCLIAFLVFGGLHLQAQVIVKKDSVYIFPKWEDQSIRRYRMNYHYSTSRDSIKSDDYEGKGIVELVIRDKTPEHYRISWKHLDFIEKYLDSTGKTILEPPHDFFMVTLFETDRSGRNPIGVGVSENEQLNREISDFHLAYGLALSTKDTVTIRRNLLASNGDTLPMDVDFLPVKIGKETITIHAVITPENVAFKNWIVLKLLANASKDIAIDRILNSFNMRSELVLVFRKSDGNLMEMNVTRKVTVFSASEDETYFLKNYPY